MNITFHDKWKELLLVCEDLGVVCRLETTERLTICDHYDYPKWRVIIKEETLDSTPVRTIASWITNNQDVEQGYPSSINTVELIDFDENPFD